MMAWIWAALLALPVAADEDAIKELWEATKLGDLEAVRGYLEAGIDPNARTEFDATALYFAASNDHPDVCRLLVEGGASMTITDRAYNNTPLGMAAWLGHHRVVDVLMELGAPDGNGAIYAAAATGQLEVVKTLVKWLKLSSPDALNPVWATAKGAGHDHIADYLESVGAEKSTLPAQPTVDTEIEGKRIFATDSDDYRPVKEPIHWATFRGPMASGNADGQHPPYTWDLESAHHIRWRAEVPGLGHSSPIIFGQRVFITTAVRAEGRAGIDQGDQGWINSVNDRDVVHQFMVLCYDLIDGKLLWSRQVKESTPRASRHWKASYANCSVAVDEDHVVALFGSDGLYVFDRDGEALWSKDLGEIRSGWFLDDSFEWGYSSSPILFDGMVIVQADGAPQAFLAAYDADTGEELWRTERDEISSYATPAVFEGENGFELITNAPHAIRGYDPQTGEELWTLSGNSRITIATPICDGETVYITNGYQTPRPIYAIGLGARGDISLQGREKTNEFIKWSNMRDGTYEPVPLVYEDRLYLVNTSTVMSCYDAATGERLYRERIAAGRQMTASPVVADGRLYFTSEDGEVYVVRAGDDYELMAINSLGEACLTTPAITNGMIVFRTRSHLLCVGHDSDPR